MRLSVFFLLLFVAQTFATATYSQQTRLTLKMQDAKLIDVLSKIEDESEFFFLFNQKLVDVERQVTVNAKNESIDKILAGIFENTNVTTLVKDRQIILTTANLEALVSAQQKSVSGKVTDSSGGGLPGVSVVIKGTTTGITTDANGNYLLSNVPENATLVFSFVGMKTQEVAVGSKSTINVVLIEDAIDIEEVVAVGYGVQKKTTITGSISTVKGEELAAIPAANISQSIAGKLAGVSMRPNGGQPGYDSPDIHIRGIVTTGNNAPLVVVDGIKRNNINQLDPNLIESITILKDAAAVAPYGIGGANGVILIATKKGKSGKPVVRFSSSYGLQNPTYLPNMLNATDYMALQNEGYFNQTPNGTTPPNDPKLIADYNKLNKDDPYKYPNSNFVDQFNTNTPVQNYSFELSGGTDKVNYHAGLGYYDQKGIFDPTNYKRYTYDISLDMQATNTTKVGMSLIGSIEKTNELDPGENIQGGHLFRAFYKFIPTQALIYPGGDKWGESSASSPMAALNSAGYSKLEKNTLLATLSVEQQLPFIKGLSAKGVFSYDPTQQNQKQWHVPFIYHKIDLSKQPYTFTEATTLQEGNSVPYKYLSLQNNRWFNYTYQAYINYNRKFGDHNITGLLVAEGRKSTSDWFSARRNNFAISIDEMNLGSSNKLDYDNGGASGTGSEIGYVYRLGYSYKDKYMFEASGRYDGHYYFAPGKRWGYFPAFSTAWRISEENFMKRFTNINSLKLRGSWGKSGMLAGSAFQYLAGYNLRGNAYAFGNSALVQGSRVLQEANPEITWEISTKMNIGFDLTMWSGLLDVSFDYFHEDRTGMLLAPQVTLPVEYGLALSQENKGRMNNNGIEINIGTRKKLSNGMELAITGNLSYAMNNMLEVFETAAQKSNPNRTLTGQPFGSPYGYKALGLFTTAEDKNSDGIIDAANDGYAVTQFGVLHPGDIKYADLSGPDGKPDGKIDSNDETRIGYPVYPAMTFGLTPELNWKNVDVTLFFQGSAMSSINTYQFMTVPFENNASNTAYEYLNNRWTKDNQGAKYPRATPSPYANNNKASDFWMVNTSFLRLKTATIGYTVPKEITERLHIAGVRIYATGQNVLTFSKIKHVDPEMGYTNRENAYPVMKTTTFGLDVTF
ncbi:MAG: SusC/RagA family TonB-linked outer membrane protein [Odoribacter sp.]|nr:SusC/RagA family TonB-linked outer membrane protein [Odoribacter sp.]